MQKDQKAQMNTTPYDFVPLGTYFPLVTRRPALLQKSAILNKGNNGRFGTKPLHSCVFDSCSQGRLKWARGAASFGQSQPKLRLVAGMTSGTH